MVHEKLSSKDFTTRVHPSTKTNNANLKGSETIAGGSIIIPDETRTQETTRSIIKKGKNTWKPIKKAVFNSLKTKAGARARHGMSS